MQQISIQSATQGREATLEDRTGGTGEQRRRELKYNTQAADEDFKKATDEDGQTLGEDRQTAGQERQITDEDSWAAVEDREGAGKTRRMCAYLNQF